jgi:hypothetical protein
MIQDSGVSAARLFQGVRQYGQTIERRFIGNRRGKIDYGTGQPPRIDYHGRKPSIEDLLVELLRQLLV